MTNQAKDTSLPSPSVPENQHEAEHSEMPQQIPTDDISSRQIENPTESSALISMPQSNQLEPFAHDINQKLDELEVDINELTGRFKASQGNLSNALGDLKSRTALMTDEIETVSRQLTQSDSDTKNLIATLDGRLSDAIALLDGQLGDVDGQLESHLASIKSLRDDLGDSYNKLELKISALQQDTQSRLQSLFTKQEEQKETQKVFSDHLDSLQNKTDKNADDLFELNTQMHANERKTRKHFYLVGGSIALCALVVAIVITYLNNHQSEVFASLDERVSGVDDRVSGFDMSTFTTVEASQALANRLGNDMTEIRNGISSLQAHTSAEFSGMGESVESIAQKVAALELSLYGPEDGALPSPKVTIHDSSWINAQPADNYSIQVVGVYRERAMIDFANRYATAFSEFPLASNVSEYRGQNWHNLVYGNFETFRDAQNALETLPAAIQKNSPWIRQISSIQKTAIQ